MIRTVCPIACSFLTSYCESGQASKRRLTEFASSKEITVSLLPQMSIVGMSVSEALGFDNFERILRPKLDRCFAGEEVKFEWISESRGRLYLSVTYSPPSIRIGRS